MQLKKYCKFWFEKPIKNYWFILWEFCGKRALFSKIFLLNFFLHYLFILVKHKQYTFFFLFFFTLSGKNTCISLHKNFAKIRLIAEKIYRFSQIEFINHEYSIQYTKNVSSPLYPYKETFQTILNSNSKLYLYCYSKMYRQVIKLSQRYKKGS